MGVRGAGIISIEYFKRMGLFGCVWFVWIEVKLGLGGMFVGLMGLGDVMGYIYALGLWDRCLVVESE